MLSTGVPFHARTQKWAFAILVAVVYFCAASLSLELSRGVGGIATIWPASGVFVAALLLAKPGQAVPISGAVVLASLAANLVAGASLAMASGFTFANLVEGLVISQLVVRRAEAFQGFDDSRWVRTFLFATLIGSATSGAIATLFSPDRTIPFFVSWITTVCLGTLIVTPLIVTLASGWRGGRANFTGRKAMALLALVLGLAMVSPLVLSFADGRFLFLPVIGIIVAAFIFGSQGAALSITVIAIAATLQNNFSGPVIQILGLSSDTLFLQFFLLSLLCAAWPLSILINQKAQLINQYADANLLLKMAESTAHIGHWHIGAENTSLFWSDEVYEIHGVDREALQFDESLNLGKSTSLELYHAEDRDRVRTILMSAMQSQKQFAYEARIVRPDGSIRHISSIGHPRYAASGDFEGLFGTFQDITEQTETLERLRIARNEALTETEKATWLSETDELTGIANRRKVLSALRAAMCTAAHEKEPVTIAIFDIDHFKSVNDRLGHHIGDEVLKRVSAIVTEQLAATDLVGRLGGEEFLVILPGQDARRGYRVIERIRLRIATECWPNAQLPRVTVSAGLATLNGSEKIEDALQRADRGLYTAKADGRNLLRAAA